MRRDFTTLESYFIVHCDDRKETAEICSCYKVISQECALAHMALATVVFCQMT